MLLSALTSYNYLIAFLLTLAIYLIAFLFYYKRVKSIQDEYVILADEYSITIRNSRSYKWEEISGLETFVSVPVGRRMPSKYLKINFLNSQSITIDASSFDMDYEELEKALQNLRKLSLRNTKN